MKLDCAISAELLDQLPSAVCVYSGGRVVYVNEAAVRLTGRTEQELTSESLDVLAMAAPISSAALREAVERYNAAPPQSAPFHFTIINAQGQQIPIAGFTRQIEWNGQTATLASVVEITTISEALHESESRYRQLVETCPDPITFTDLEGRMLMGNAELAHMHGYDTVDELLHEVPFIYNLAVPQARQRARASMQQVLEHGFLRNAEYTVQRRDGSLVPVQVNGSLLLDGAGRPQGFIAVARDITAHKKLVELKGALSSKVLAAQEQERWRVSRELHDGVGQLLAVIKMEADWLSTHPEDRGEVLGAAERIREKANQTLELVREMAHGLRPAVLDDLGVSCALETLAKDVTKHGPLTCEASCAEGIEVEAATGTAIYRIAQEALANVLRHAEASHAWVRLEADGPDGRVELTIEDDGVGIERALATSDTLGIAGMRERATLLGGTLAIRAREAGGTVVRAVLPRREKPQPR